LKREEKKLSNAFKEAEGEHTNWRRQQQQQQRIDPFSTVGMQCDAMRKGREGGQLKPP